MNRKYWALILAFSSLGLVVLGILQLVTVKGVNCRLIDDVLANTLLATMGQILAGILAIVFSVSALAVTIVSDRYTPRLFVEFKRDPVTLATFGFNAIAILIVIAAIGSSLPMCQWGFWFALLLLFTSLIFMGFYLINTISYLDPTNLAVKIQEEGLAAIKEENVTRVKEKTSALGDIAFKAFSRGEEQYCQKYLEAIQAIQLKLSVQNDPNIEFVLEVSSTTLDQYYRLFQVALRQGRQGFVEQIAEFLSQNIDALTQQDTNSPAFEALMTYYEKFISDVIASRNPARFELLSNITELVFAKYELENFSKHYLPVCLRTLTNTVEAIIEHLDFNLWRQNLGNSQMKLGQVYNSLDVRLSPTNNVPNEDNQHLYDARDKLRQLNNQTVAVVEAAIKSRSPIRDSLVLKLTGLVTFHLSEMDVDGVYYRQHLRILLRIFQIMIEQEDFELWGTGIDYLTAGQPPAQHVHQRLRDSLVNIAKQIPDHDPAWPYEWARELLREVQPYITVHNQRIFELRLSPIQQHISAGANEIEQQLSVVRGEFQRLRINSDLADIFFQLCSYALSRNLATFVRELWLKSQEVHGINLVHFDVGFLTYYVCEQMRLPSGMRDYLSALEDSFIERYYLLSLAYTLHSSQRLRETIWSPVIPYFDSSLLDKGDELAQVVSKQIQYIHSLLSNLHYRMDQVLEQHEAVLALANEWDNLFNGRAYEALVFVGNANLFL